MQAHVAEIIHIAGRVSTLLLLDSKCNSNTCNNYECVLIVGNENISNPSEALQTPMAYNTSLNHAVNTIRCKP